MCLGDSVGGAAEHRNVGAQGAGGTRMAETGVGVASRAASETSMDHGPSPSNWNLT